MKSSLARQREPSRSCTSNQPAFVPASPFARKLTSECPFSDRAAEAVFQSSIAGVAMRTPAAPCGPATPSTTVVPPPPAPTLHPVGGGRASGTVPAGTAPAYAFGETHAPPRFTTGWSKA